MLLENQQLGRYHIVRLLGSGGMGDVYLAEDARINQQVAVKVIYSEISASQDEHVRLFEREVKAIAKLDHANILPLYDYGEQHIGETQVMYLVMPYRPEGSLTKWLLQKRSGELLSFQQTVHLVLQAAEALQHAHSRQIIHQDVKPSNFLIRERESTPNFPDILLADFGIARLMSATVNASQSIRGTPTYMAPEQYAGHPVSASDQYALAVMVYELLTGIPPFRGGPMQIMYQHLHDQPQRASHLNPRLSQDVDTVLLHALAKKPEARFASVTAFANALQQSYSQREVEVAVPQPVSQASVNELPSGSNIPALEELHDLRAMLAISREEALRGTARTITLPGGRHTSVTIPPGVQSGQELHLNTQEGTKGETLILTILVKEETENISPAFIEKNEQTIMDSKGEIIDNGEALIFSTPPSTIEENIVIDAPVLSEGAKNVLSSRESGKYLMPEEQHTHILHTEEKHTPTSPLAITASPSIQPPFTQVYEKTSQSNSVSGVRQRSKTGLLLALAIILIIVSIFGITSYQSHIVHVNATGATAIALAHKKATSIALSKAQATQEMATVVAMQTEVAQAEVVEASQETATAQAQVQAMAKANPYPAYLADHGKFASYDSLRPPTQWYATDSDPNCTMSGNAYHVIAPTNQYISPCYNMSTTEFGNFALEVQMTIVQGDCGGIIFRSNTNSYKDFYFYMVCQNQTYELIKYISNKDSDSIVLPSPSTDNAAIHAGLNQTNIITVLAQDKTLTLYINKQQVASVQDGSYQKGAIALVACPYANGNPTNVIYSNARIWTF